MSFKTVSDEPNQPRVPTVQQPGTPSAQDSIRSERAATSATQTAPKTTRPPQTNKAQKHGHASSWKDWLNDDKDYLAESCIVI